MKKIAAYNADKAPGHMYFFCPGCGEYHSFDVNVHRVTGTLQEPTVATMIVRMIEKFNKSKHGPLHVCDSFIVAGNIRFTETSTHPLAGKTVELPDLDTVEKIQAERDKGTKGKDLKSYNPPKMETDYQREQKPLKKDQSY